MSHLYQIPKAEETKKNNIQLGQLVISKTCGPFFWIALLLHVFKQINLDHGTKHLTDHSACQPF